MASREELLKSINPEMRLTRVFFLKVYGYEISFPGFAEIAIKVLEDAGCSRARSYYDQIVQEYKQKHEEKLKTVAIEYVKQLDQQREKKWSDKSLKEKEMQKLSNEDFCRQIMKW